MIRCCKFGGAFPLRYLVALVAVLLMANCSRAVLVKPSLSVRAPEEPRAEVGSGMIPDEIRRLEDLINSPRPRSGDTAALSRIRLARDLFALLIRTDNPAFDYDKAVAYAAMLRDGLPDQRLYYASWIQVLSDRVLLAVERDSLAATVEELSEKVKTLKASTKQQATEIERLSALVKSQEETLQNLGKLDVKMEQQRSKIR